MTPTPDTPTPAGLTAARQAEPFAPRTYQSAWQWDKEGRPKMMTAEEWLEEEAYVQASLSAGEAEPDDDGPDNAGTMLAISKEIATLRRERTQWADECTRKAAALDAATAALARANADVQRLEDRTDWLNHNCRIVYFPPGDEYPVEHNMAANKDSWFDLMEYAARASRATPDAAARPGEG